MELTKSGDLKKIYVNHDVGTSFDTLKIVELPQNFLLFRTDTKYMLKFMASNKVVRKTYVHKHTALQIDALARKSNINVISQPDTWEEDSPLEFREQLNRAVDMLMKMDQTQNRRRR